jgi:transposase
MRKILRSLRHLKKLRRPAGGDPTAARAGNANRNLVPEPVLGLDPRNEARIGQKNKITRRWARRGSRPPAPHDQRTKWAYIFGAICPAKGKGAGLVMPYCDTPAMQDHLAEISATVERGAHAVLLLDQAGWHMSAKLKVPDNITLLPLPPRSPELNPQENIWQFLRDNWLSNRVFMSYDDIVAHCCEAWNKLTDQPWRIMSIGLRDWAHAF